MIDKTVSILDVVAAKDRSLAELVEATGFSRATVHRLAASLEAHGLLRRSERGRYALGWKLVTLGRAAESGDALVELAMSVLADLRDETGESVQMYVRDGSQRRCVASLDSPDELRTVVAPGARLPLDRGSAGAALRGVEGASGWVASVGERAAGVASVSAPVRDATGAVVAALGVSGPVERTTDDPGSRYGNVVAEAARRVSVLLG
ncbi:MAG: IclR family transcriptional regulator [Actinomycetota bacterium]|nr:IclR family transcriptional regulator [Actinomycetota bacterium]